MSASSAGRSVRHHRQFTDRSISQAYARLARDSRARGAFTELLLHVRQRAPRLLRAPVVHGHHPGVTALFHLSQFAEEQIRPPTTWDGGPWSWRPAIAALAQHLLARYPVPAFLAAAWYAAAGPFDEATRRWFIAHAAGARFRSLDLPIDLTSRMEHLFLRSSDHFGIEYAMRRAELIGLGVPDPLTEAVLATRIATDLTQGAFWRTLWRFLIAHAGAITSAQVGPIVDFLHAIRHERVPVQTPDGMIMQEPPQPLFSLKGRTPRSLLRLIDGWHRGLGLVSGGLSWSCSRLQPMRVAIPRQDPSLPPLAYELVELTDSEQLRAEGAALHHCVATYSHRCWRGASRIWSLRSSLGARSRSVVTIEVDPARQMVIQARGYRNQLPSGRALQLLTTWAARERLRVRL